MSDADAADVIEFPPAGRRTSTGGDAAGGEAVDDPVDDVPRLRDVIGQVLRDERLDQERTLAEVADRASVSLPYLSEVERGVKEVSSDVLAAICDALELPLDRVLERSVHRIRGGSDLSATLLAA